jgi:hypothetical protein
MECVSQKNIGSMVNQWEIVLIRDRRDDKKVIPSPFRPKYVFGDYLSIYFSVDFHDYYFISWDEKASSVEIENLVRLEEIFRAFEFCRLLSSTFQNFKFSTAYLRVAGIHLPKTHPHRRWALHSNHTDSYTDVHSHLYTLTQTWVERNSKFETNLRVLYVWNCLSTLSVVARIE